MNTAQVTLPSITGVDVLWRIAGPGSRSYAFLIDWHIRAILAFAWFFVGSYLYLGTLSFLEVDASERGGAYIWIIVLPSVAIYLLYHPLLEIAMHGRTPGKRMAGVRIVTRTGDTPGAGALLLRNVFRLIDSAPLFYVLGLGVVVFTEQHVRIGDLAAGTLLVLDDADAERSLAAVQAATTSGLDAKSADLVQELLDRWPALDESTRANIARSLLARLDPTQSAAALLAAPSHTLRERLEHLLRSAA